MPTIRRNQREYMALLEPAFDLVRKIIFPKLDDFKEQHERNRTMDSATRTDDLADELTRAFDFVRVQFGRTVPADAFETAAKDSARRINRENQDFNRRQVQTVLGLDPIQAEPWLQQEINDSVKAGVDLIVTLPEDTFSRIEAMVQRRVKAGDSTAKLKSQIQDEFGNSEGRARVIARDQTSKLNASLSEHRQRDLGVTRYIWRTSDDGAVRDDHERLDDTEQKWSEPPITVTSGKRNGERNHPGMDIQCRCTAEPVFDDLI